MAANHEPQDGSELSVEAVRAIIAGLRERRSLRQIATEAGVGREAVQRFVEGGSMPYGSTAKKLREYALAQYGTAAQAVSLATPAPLPASPGLAAPPATDIVRMRLDSARRAFGSDAELAEVLGVDRAQPSRWRAGQAPDPLNRERIVAVDVVVELLSTWLSPASIPKWLNGVNAHLGNRRPVAVLRDGGLSEVVAAIEAEKAGAFA
jgi:transcriptional regulator with XRE-family HTH domain